jgi:hypothetical protein
MVDIVTHYDEPSALTTESRLDVNALRISSAPGLSARRGNNKIHDRVCRRQTKSRSLLSQHHWYGALLWSWSTVPDIASIFGPDGPNDLLQLVVLDEARFDQRLTDFGKDLSRLFKRDCSHFGRSRSVTAVDLK